MSAPEIGQVVEIRQRPWVVVDRAASAFAPDAVRGIAEPQHLLTLSSIADDGLGEELQVLWEIEPSLSIREQSGLPAPAGFDDPTERDAFLDAVRWGSVSSADLKALQAPFRSGIEIEDYQLDPNRLEQRNGRIDRHGQRANRVCIFRPTVFDHSLAQGRDDLVLAHLNHRLVQMCLHLLRAEIRSTASRRKLHRVTARTLPNEALDTPAVIAHGRILVLGGDNHRLHEEIIGAGGTLQLDLRSDSERAQRDRDTANLRARLESIPGEIAREEANIRRRSADPVPRLFPAAVTFLAPERYAHA